MTAPWTLPAPLVEDVVRAALAEDFGRAGDITTQATIPGRRPAPVIAAREAGIVAGLGVAACAFRLVDPAVVFTPAMLDGARIGRAMSSPISKARRAPFSRPSASL